MGASSGNNPCIVKFINPQPGERIVEIGPGAGALTFPLLKRHGEIG